MIYDHIYKTTGLVHKNQNFVGSSVIFRLGNELYAITAGHNIYGKKFDEQPSLNDFHLEDYCKTQHTITAIIGDRASAKENDIVCLKLKCSSTLNNFVSIKFCTIPKNPKLSLIFRGKSKQIDAPVTHRNIIFNTINPLSEHTFFCKMDRSLLTNDIYVSGSDWLAGWSGSGIFIDNHKDLICAGIMNEIPNKGNDGQLLFCNTVPLINLGCPIEIIQAEDLDFDRDLSAASLSAIIDSFDEKSIEEWEKQSQDSKQLNHLNRKLNEVYPASSFENNKIKIIKHLLIGKTYLTTELAKYEQLEARYKSAYKVYDLESKDCYVNSRPEALTALTNIKLNYENYLLNELGSELPGPDIKLLAIYGVSEWITNCSLDFIKNE